MNKPAISRPTIRPSRALPRDESGVALIEFAFSLPIILAISLTGAELTNYATTKMRISQVALHLGDHAARIGDGSPLAAKEIDEQDINDVLVGAGLQAGTLDLYTHGRVILSSLEPVATPNTTNRFKIAWQRCRGSKLHTSSYGVAGATNLTGMGRAGDQVIAPEGGVTMFVEVSYDYQPIVDVSLAPAIEITEIAAMPVRDRRNTSDDTMLPNGTTNPNPQHPNGVYKVAGVTASTC